MARAMPGHDFSPGIGLSREDLLDIDTSAAHPARVYDYWLGGTENFAADRAAGDEAIAAFPGIVAAVRANRAFLARAVGYMAAAACPPTTWTSAPASQRPATPTRWRSGPPRTPGSSTSTRTRSWPGTRPACCRPPAPGPPGFIAGDVRDPDAILARARRTLDFSQPVAIMLLGILQLIPDADDPPGMVARLGQAAVPGSYLAISHPARDILAAGQGDLAERLSEQLHRPGAAQPCRRAAHVRRVHPGPAGAGAAGPLAPGTGGRQRRPALHRARRGRPQARHRTGPAGRG